MRALEPAKGHWLQDMGPGSLGLVTSGPIVIWEEEKAKEKSVRNRSTYGTHVLLKPHQHAGREGAT